MSATVLAYPDPNKEYLLKTDASRLGLGAVLSQKQSDGRYYPVAFRSWVLHGAEVNYHSTKLKFLAMKWSIEHFQTYHYQEVITVFVKWSCHTERHMLKTKQKEETDSIIKI